MENLFIYLVNTVYTHEKKCIDNSCYSFHILFP